MMPEGNAVAVRQRDVVPRLGDGEDVVRRRYHREKTRYEGTPMRAPFLKRLEMPRPLLLDGATGTELARRGIDLNVPSWTAGVIHDQPEVLRQIHRDYVEAGTEIVTAYTFRTHARNLESLGLAHQARELTLRAVEIAREACKEKAYVAGCVAPLEDCYSPQLTPDIDQLRREHAHMAGFLAEAGVDVILIETQVTIREAVIAAEAAQATGLPFCVSFVCGRSGDLLSGETLVDAWRALASLSPAVFLVNCLPGEEVLSALSPLMANDGGPRLGAYANTGRLLPGGVWEATSGVLPAVYAGYARAWIESGLRVIGGCCGTTPEHISAIRACL
ncbi:homocysteine S-methyltransferase family protein [Planctomicrobium piriforme]|uniref:Homocysteine S-methyltransferase n=1 Tax=Planctomicrobium piriforme TaxID=1576369 RepID=A0A1I3HCY3_9PLAN|nr:homocysteine S-methyltransferase family protein [Planctomicrobium piriforme]SFI33595.1 homocysteine S-methyltransferase [Planctomicrobium piriforme]